MQHDSAYLAAEMSWQTAASAAYCCCPSLLLPSPVVQLLPCAFVPDIGAALVPLMGCHCFVLLVHWYRVVHQQSLLVHLQLLSLYAWVPGCLHLQCAH